MVVEDPIHHTDPSDNDYKYHRVNLGIVASSNKVFALINTKAVLLLVTNNLVM
jgi:hypothetical protein